MRLFFHWIDASLCFAAAGLLVVAAENGATTRGAAASAAPQATAQASIEIDNFSFKPRQLEVKAGTAVTWVNRDDVPHTATAKGTAPAFNSRTLDTDDRYTFTFEKPGTYSYFCKIHPHMTATVVVK
jgi:plastocyanin